MSHIENLSPEQISVSDIAREGIGALQTQIRSAMRRVSLDDLGHQFFNNALGAADTLLVDIQMQANAEISQFNDLCDELDKKNLALGLAQSEVKELRTQLARGTEELREEYEGKLFAAEKRRDELELIVGELNSRIANQKTALETLQAQLRGLERDYKRVLAMEPEKLAKKLADAKKETRELREEHRTMGQALRKEQSARIASSNEVMTMTLAMQRLRDDNQLLALELSKVNAASNIQFVAKQDDSRDLLFWLQRFGHGLSNNTELRKRVPAIVENISFNYIIASDLGFSINTRVSEWCWPVYNNFEGFSKFAPPEMFTALKDLFESELTVTHPQLVRRAQWAATVAVGSIPEMPIKAPALLEGTVFETLYDVVRREPEALLTVKGIGNAMARLIYEACLNMAKAWEAENGPVEALW